MDYTLNRWQLKRGIFMIKTHQTNSHVGLNYWVLILLSTLFLLSFSHPIFAADQVGQMVWVKGTVKALSVDQTSRTLQRRSPIYASDTLVTGASDEGQIVFTDNSVVVLRSDTEFKIDQYKFNKTSPSEGQYAASVAKGGFRTITGLISKANPDNYRVNTPVATIGVRGTDYSIHQKWGWRCI
jgi:hypothetical protein